MSKNPHILISYLKSFPIQEDIIKFESAISSPKLELVVDARDPIPFAALEWFIPTAIVIYISKSYFDSFFSEMGKDHYSLLKDAIKNFGAKYIKEDRFKISYIASGREKISSDNIYTNVFSIMSETQSGLRVKLLLQKDIAEEEYFIAVELFLGVLEALDSSHASQGMIFVGFDRQTKKIEFLDPLKNLK